MLQRDVHKEPFIRFDVLILDEGTLIGDVDQEAIILVAQARAVSDGLIQREIVAEIAQQ